MTGRTLWWRCEQNTIASPAFTKRLVAVPPMNSAVEIVAGSREHDVESVYATTIVMLLMF